MTKLSEIYFSFILFTNLFNVDNLQIKRYSKKLKNTIAYQDSLATLFNSGSTLIVVNEWLFWADIEEYGTK